MKWLFLLMVAVNIVIYVWGLQRETGTSEVLDPRYRNIGEIRLLTKAEIESSSIEQITEKDTASEYVVSAEQQEIFGEKISTTALDTREAEQGSEVELKPETAFNPEPELSLETEPNTEAEFGSLIELPSEGEDGAAVIADSLEQDNESAEAVDTTMVASTEVSEDSLPVQVEATKSSEPETVVIQEEMRCWTLGPISQQPVAFTLLKAVEKKVAFAGLREEMEKSITGYWVVLPPYENASAANRVVEQLKARDVVDVQRFYRGEFQNGVSLGVYNQRYNAEKRKAQIETKGYSPDVLERFKEESRYWVDFRSGSQVDVLADIPSDYRDLDVTQRVCGDQRD